MNNKTIKSIYNENYAYIRKPVFKNCIFTSSPFNNAA